MTKTVGTMEIHSESEWVEVRQKYMILNITSELQAEHENK